MSENFTISKSNQLWITDKDEQPTPKILPKIGSWRILVRPVAPQKVTKGGIILSGMTLEEKEYLQTVGEVLYIGPLAYTRADMQVEGKVTPWCKVGDYALYGKYAGVKIMYKGIKFLVLNDDEVLATVKDPSDIA